MRHLVLALILSSSLLACERKSPEEVQPPITEDQDPAAPTADASPDAGQVDGAALVEEPVEEEQALQLSPPLVDLPTSLAELEASWQGQDIGRLSGDLFGSDRIVRAISLISCGEGSVLQFVFEGEDGIQVLPPMKMPFIELPLGREVAYTEAPYDILIHLTHHSEDRLAGSKRISWKRGGIEVDFINVTFDGPVTKVPIPPRLEGMGDLPVYDRCTPSAYFVIEDEQGTQQARGLAAVKDIENSGAPLIVLPLSTQDSIQIMIIPPRRNQLFEEAQEVMLEAVRLPGSEPAAILAEVMHFPEIVPAREATGRNIARRSDTLIISGRATFRTWRTGDRHEVELTIEKMEIPSLIQGQLRGRTLDKLRVRGIMLPAKDLNPQLPDEPDWW